MGVLQKHMADLARLSERGPTALERRGMDSVDVLAWGDVETLVRPCVDCGLRTGWFCDGLERPCFARHWLPKELWARGQRTPLCSRCERLRGTCHYCRRVQSATPPAHGGAAPQSGLLSSCEE